MVKLKKMRKRLSDSDAQSLIEEFEQLVKKHEDRTYGLALLFELLSVVYARDERTLDLYRLEHGSLIEEERATLFRALDLLNMVRENPAEASELKDFDFRQFKDYDEADELISKCDIMVAAYLRIFPDRSRELPFEGGEVLRLADEAYVQLKEQQKV